MVFIHVEMACGVRCILVAPIRFTRLLHLWPQGMFLFHRHMIVFCRDIKGWRRFWQSYHCLIFGLGCERMLRSMSSHVTFVRREMLIGVVSRLRCRFCP